MTTVLLTGAWLFAVLGAGLAYLIALAGGMRTVPKIEGHAVAVALPLPLLALVFSSMAWSRAGGSTAVQVLAVLPGVLAALGLAILVLSYLGQPSRPGIVRWLRGRRG